MKTAIHFGQYDVVRLLLCNGYDVELEHQPPLQEALKARKYQIVRLLLDWGMDPKTVWPWLVFDSYDRVLFERFYTGGLDFTRDDELAGALAWGNNKPLYGWVKQKQADDPRIRHELNRALIEAIEHKKERGIALCLWAGADPHEQVGYDPIGQPRDDEDIDLRRSAIEYAVDYDRIAFLETVGVDPERDDCVELLDRARSSRAVEAIARSGCTFDWNSLAERTLWQWIIWGLESHNCYCHNSFESKLKYVFGRGGRITKLNPDHVKSIRREVANFSKWHLEDIARLLANAEWVADDVAVSLLSAPAFKRNMEDLRVPKWRLKQLDLVKAKKKPRRRATDLPQKKRKRW